jgi:hypothetical protein
VADGPFDFEMSMAPPEDEEGPLAEEELASETKLSAVRAVRNALKKTGPGADEALSDALTSFFEAMQPLNINDVM